MKTMNRPVLVVAAALALAGCESLTGPDRVQPPLTELPRALTVHERGVIRASNGFAFDILRETLRDQPATNVFLSPVSASMALGMAMNGADGATLEGMQRALGFSGMQLQHINESYRDLIALLRGLDRAVDMRIANSVWAERSFPFHDSFMQTARTWFDAEVTRLDFTAHDAARTINRWVDRSTAGRISSIVDDPIPADMVMYLINAIYFKGDWRHQFERAQTRDATFTRDDGTATTVRMMHRTGPAAAAQLPDGSGIIEMQYGRGAYVMNVVLPAPGRSVDQLIEQLSPDTWNAWLDAMRDSELHIGLPRFRLEYETTMNQPLITLGMGAAFGVEPGTDFSRMSPLGHLLEISQVKQKTYVDVNEEGTEAAAVTAVGIRVVSAPPSFIADRPFLVVIRERFSGTILFIGRIGDPKAP